MFTTLSHLQNLTHAYEQGHITEQELIKEWADLLNMLYLRLLESAFSLVKKRRIEA